MSHSDGYSSGSDTDVDVEGRKQELDLKSQKKYDVTSRDYEVFCEKQELRPWRKSSTEEYIRHLRRDKSYMASTLWTKLSHLKQGYALRDKDTPDFKFLHSLLKKWGKSEPPKQAQEFSQSEFASILRLCHERSSDPRFLLMGTVAIVGTFGMYRNAEIWQFTTDMVHEDKLGFWLDYVGTSKNVPVGMQMRKFIPHQMLPHDGQVNPQPAKILGMYLQCLEQQLGPNYSGPLFMTLRNEKFIKVRMGVNKLAEISKRLASEIGVDLSGRTGHVWRATGASLLAAGGAQDGEIMRAGGWKSAAAARRYIRKSDLTSINVTRMQSGQPRADSVFCSEVVNDAREC